MARPANDSYELTDAERRDLIKLIERGDYLPEKYRYLLFKDKREVELIWNGKTRDVTTAVLPFQTLEHIDEPRKEQRADAALELDMGGRQAKGWTNKLIWGDNKLILSSLKSGALRRQIEDAGGLRLIYIDPPFDVGADFSVDIEIGGETFHKEPNLIEQIAYRDTWGRGADSFIAMIYERAALMYELLSRDGILYLHCDWRVSAYVRLVLDEVFGKDKFVNEIVWHYYNKMQGNVGRFASNHDVIISYRKGESFPFSTLREARDKPKTQQKRVWDKATQTLKQARDENGALVYYEDTERTIDDVWRMHYLMPADKTERLDYPTQKPEALVQRIIESSSRQGDLIGDFFVGSGTTAAVAEKLGRKWIASDLGKFGIHTTRKRLIQVQRELKTAGKPFRAFEVLNLGRYERQAYLNVSGRLSGKQKAEALARKEREFRELILRAYKAQPLAEGGFFQGKIGSRLVVVGPINLPVGRLFVEEVITECRKRQATRVDILAFEFEMGLFPAVLDEAKMKGIDVAPKTIPPEVFDKRAVDKGQVRFHDVAYIEVTPRYSATDPLTVQLELTDFSVYYSQGLVESISKELKVGKCEVVCDAGRLIKICKDKNGVESHSVLTKHWTDWVDYWAVDFDYESRKEVIVVPKNLGTIGELDGLADSSGFVEFEERWTGSYIFENEWQSFRTRRDRSLELKSASHTYPKSGRYVVAVKVIDIFGNDTTSLLPLTVG